MHVVGYEATHAQLPLVRPGSWIKTGVTKVALCTHANAIVVQSLLKRLEQQTRVSGKNIVLMCRNDITRD